MLKSFRNPLKALGVMAIVIGTFACTAPPSDDVAGSAGALSETPAAASAKTGLTPGLYSCVFPANTDADLARSGFSIREESGYFGKYYVATLVVESRNDNPRNRMPGQYTASLSESTKTMRSVTGFHYEASGRDVVISWTSRDGTPMVVLVPEGGDASNPAKTVRILIANQADERASGSFNYAFRCTHTDGDRQNTEGPVEGAEP